MPGSTPADLDVRELPPSEKHPTVLAMFDDLEVGESFSIVDDHDPISLRSLLQAKRAGEMDWTYLSQAPNEWRVRLERIRDPMA